MYQRRQYNNRYSSQYKPQKALYQPRPYYKKRFTQMDKVRKLTGTEPETTVEKIAKGVGTVATIAKTVAGIVSMINVEDKYLDTGIVQSVTASGTYTQTLNLVAQGIDRSQRNGNKILCKSIQLNIQVSMAPTDTALTRNLRMVLLFDKKPQISGSTGASFDDIYAQNTPIAFIDKDNAGDRYVILRDWKVALNSSDKRLIWEEWYKDLSRIHTQYTSASPVAFENGRLILVAISDAATDETGVQLYGNARFCFADN